MNKQEIIDRMANGITWGTLVVAICGFIALILAGELNIMAGYNTVLCITFVNMIVCIATMTVYDYVYCREENDEE